MEQQYKTDAEIYAVLEREIIDLTLRPGSSLSENPLCARFGAPRSMIRVVLQRLQENGLVKIVPYKGTTVTRLNREIVDELIYERTAVEARVLRDFSPKCTPEQRALIRRRADAYAALARAEEIDYNKLYEADRLLHETWFAAMGKMYLWRTLQNAHADYSRFRMLDSAVFSGAKVREYESALQALQTMGDALTGSLQRQWQMEQQQREQILQLSHKLKTPLTIVEGNAELLAEDALTPEQREQVQAILGGVEQTRTYLGRIRAEVQTPLKYKTKKNDKTCRIVEN